MFTGQLYQDHTHEPVEVQSNQNRLSALGIGAGDPTTSNKIKNIGLPNPNSKTEYPHKEHREQESEPGSEFPNEHVQN